MHQSIGSRLFVSQSAERSNKQRQQWKNSKPINSQIGINCLAKISEIILEAQ